MNATTRTVNGHSLSNSLQIYLQGTIQKQQNLEILFVKMIYFLFHFIANLTIRYSLVLTSGVSEELFDSTAEFRLASPL